jgi:hypothetical protein
MKKRMNTNCLYKENRPKCPKRPACKENVILARIKRLVSYVLQVYARTHRTLRTDITYARGKGDLP